MQALHHLAFRTCNLEALCGFYEEVFGWRPVREQQGYSVWYELDGVMLMFERADDEEPVIPQGSGELVALRVSAAEREMVRVRLQARGEPVESQTKLTLYFRDPDGRRVGVSTYDFSG
jgi:catechol 2,3-dioxygenase-like lactoylglutathione lyase family enzyme